MFFWDDDSAKIFRSGKRSAGLSGVLDGDLGQSIPADLSLFTKILDQIISEYKFKIGEFLQFSFRIENLKNRSYNLTKISAGSAAGQIFMSRADTLLKIQKDLELKGADVLTLAASLKDNVIIKEIQAGRLTATALLSADMIWRLTDLWSRISSLKSNLADVWKGYDSQKAAITALEKDIKSKEDELAGLGLLTKITTPVSGIFGDIKTIAIAAAAGIAAITILPKLLGNKKII